MNTFTIAGITLDAQDLLRTSKLAPAVQYNKGSDEVVIPPLESVLQDLSLKEPLAMMREGIVTVMAVSNPQMHQRLVDEQSFHARYMNKHLLKKCLVGQVLSLPGNQVKK